MIPFFAQEKAKLHWICTEKGFPYRQQDPEKGCCTNQRNDDEGTGILNDK